MRRLRGSEAGSASRRVLQPCAVEPVGPTRVVHYRFDTRTYEVVRVRPIGGRRHEPPPQHVHSSRRAATWRVRGRACTASRWETSCGGAKGAASRSPSQTPLFSTTAAGARGHIPQHHRDRGGGRGKGVTAAVMAAVRRDTPSSRLRRATAGSRKDQTDLPEHRIATPPRQRRTAWAKRSMD